MRGIPFLIDLIPITEPGRLTIDVDLQGTLRESGNELPVLLSPMEDLANLGGVGGLAGDRFAPKDSQLKLLASQRISEQKLSWSFDYKYLDPRALNVFINVLNFFHLRLAPIHNVLIKVSQDLLSDRPSNEMPPMFRPLPFVLSDEREEAESNFAIRIRFQSEHPDATLMQAEEAFGHWFCAASIGAFAGPTYPPDLCKIYLGDEPVYAGDTLVLYIEQMTMNQFEALESLVNVFQWVHAHVAQIADVEFS